MAVGPDLHGRTAALTPIAVADAGRVIAIRNAPGADVGLPPIPDDIPRQERWISAQRSAPDDYYYGVRPALADCAIVGTIGLTLSATISGEWSQGNAWEWGRWASSADDPRIAVEAAALILRFALDIDVEAVWIRLLPSNVRLIALHRRLGYSREWTNAKGTFMRADQPDIESVARRLALAAG
jgi:RimJ/RimL family protein N-acetyltransferase